MSNPAVNLVVVSHPDDEALAMGGTGARLTRAGEIVQPVMLCGGVAARGQRPADEELAADIGDAMATLGFAEPILGDFPNIRMNTVAHIEIVSFIEEQIRTFRPKRIFTHHVSDANDDHRKTAEATLVAARLPHRQAGLEPVESIHLMETVSATDWTYPGTATPFLPNEFVDITDTLEQKLKACECYRNVMRPFPHSRSPEVIRGLAAVRGAQSGTGYAEAFQTVYSRRIV